MNIEGDPPPGPFPSSRRPIHHPDFEAFRALVGQAPCVPVFRRMTSDGLTPVSAFRRIEL